MAKETVEGLCQKAQGVIAEGDYALARTFYQQALGLRSNDPDIHYGLATVCFLLSDLASSAYHFKEVTRLDPLRAGAYVNLGAVYNRLEQYDDAIPALRRGIQLDMTRGEGYYNLGLVYRNKGQADMAVQAYREAVRVNPRMADAHYNIANIYYEKQQIGLAIAHYRKALELRPRWEKALHGLEAAQEATGEDADSGMASVDETAHEENHPVPQAKPFDPDRLVDPNLHGELLRTLHRTTIEAENEGRLFHEVLEKKVEPAIKELSSCLLYPDTPIAKVTEQVRQFEEALAAMRVMQKKIRAHIEQVTAATDEILES